MLCYVISVRQLQSCLCVTLYVIKCQFHYYCNFQSFLLMVLHQQHQQLHLVVLPPLQQHHCLSIILRCQHQVMFYSKVFSLQQGIFFCSLQQLYNWLCWIDLYSAIFRNENPKMPVLLLFINLTVWWLIVITFGSLPWQDLLRIFNVTFFKTITPQNSNWLDQVQGPVGK